jgi:hypothetical protein
MSARTRTPVMESASSRMMTLNGGQGKPLMGLPTLVAAKPLILLRTTEIPRSSEALSSRTRVLASSGPKSWRTTARAEVVLPVPGGP